MKLLLTGGAGFIGSAVVRWIMERTDWQVLNLDSLTYAGNLASLSSVAYNPRYRFQHANIRDMAAMQRAFAAFEPDAVMHLAAESHVDRSIDSPIDFLATNVIGTYTILQAALQYYERLAGPKRERFRFHHVSTDEVFGALGDTGKFSEDSPYQPQTRPTRQARPRRIILPAHGSTRSVCRWSSAIARTITAHTNFRKSSSR